MEGAGGLTVWAVGNMYKSEETPSINLSRETKKTEKKGSVLCRVVVLAAVMSLLGRTVVGGELHDRGDACRGTMRLLSSRARQHVPRPVEGCCTRYTVVVPVDSVVKY